MIINNQDDFFTQETLIGKFVVGGVVSKSPGSEVREARDMESGKVVALKIMDKEWIWKNDMSNLVRKEIDIMRELHHPNVAKLVEVFNSEAHVFVATEATSGGDLHDMLRREKRIDESRAREFFQQLMSAVGYLHSRGVAHRNIELDNVLLSADGTKVKVSDFRFGARLDEGLLGKKQKWKMPWGSKKPWGRQQQQTATPHRNPAYTSPEFIKASDERRHDSRGVDVWRAGVCLFALVTGSMPFRGGNARETLDTIQKIEPVYPDLLSTSLTSLLKGILRKNPSKRLTVEGALHHPWTVGSMKFSTPEPSDLSTAQSSDFAEVRTLRNAGWTGTRKVTPAAPGMGQMAAKSAMAEHKSMKNRAVPYGDSGETTLSPTAKHSENAPAVVWQSAGGRSDASPANARQLGAGATGSSSSSKSQGSSRVASLFERFRTGGVGHTNQEQEQAQAQAQAPAQAQTQRQVQGAAPRYSLAVAAAAEHLGMLERSPSAESFHGVVPFAYESHFQGFERAPFAPTGRMSPVLPDSRSTTMPNAGDGNVSRLLERLRTSAGGNGGNKHEHQHQQAGPMSLAAKRREILRRSASVDSWRDDVIAGVGPREDGRWPSQARTGNCAANPAQTGDGGGGGFDGDGGSGRGIGGRVWPAPGTEAAPPASESIRSRAARTVNLGNGSRADINVKCASWMANRSMSLAVPTNPFQHPSPAPTFSSPTPPTAPSNLSDTAFPPSKLAGRTAAGSACGPRSGVGIDSSSSWLPCPTSHHHHNSGSGERDLTTGRAPFPPPPLPPTEDPSGCSGAACPSPRSIGGCNTGQPATKGVGMGEASWPLLSSSTTMTMSSLSKDVTPSSSSDVPTPIPHEGDQDASGTARPPTSSCGLSFDGKVSATAAAVPSCRQQQQEEKGRFPLPRTPSPKLAPLLRTFSSEPSCSTVSSPAESLFAQGWGTLALSARASEQAPSMGPRKHASTSSPAEDTTRAATPQVLEDCSAGCSSTIARGARVEPDDLMEPRVLGRLVPGGGAMKNMDETSSSYVNPVGEMIPAQSQLAAGSPQQNTIGNMPLRGAAAANAAAAEEKGTGKVAAVGGGTVEEEHAAAMAVDAVAVADDPDTALAACFDRATSVKGRMLLRPGSQVTEPVEAVEPPQFVGRSPLAGKKSLVGPTAEHGESKMNRPTITLSDASAQAQLTALSGAARRVAPMESLLSSSTFSSSLSSLVGAKLAAAAISEVEDDESCEAPVSGATVGQADVSVVSKMTPEQLRRGPPASETMGSTGSPDEHKKEVLGLGGREPVEKRKGGGEGIGVKGGEFGEGGRQYVGEGTKENAEGYDDAKVVTGDKGELEGKFLSSMRKNTLVRSSSRVSGVWQPIYVSDNDDGAFHPPPGPAPPSFSQESATGRVRCTSRNYSEPFTFKDLMTGLHDEPLPETSIGRPRDFPTRLDHGDGDAESAFRGGIDDWAVTDPGVVVNPGHHRPAMIRGEGTQNIRRLAKEETIWDSGSTLSARGDDVDDPNAGRPIVSGRFRRLNSMAEASPGSRPLAAAGGRWQGQAGKGGGGGGGREGHPSGGGNKADRTQDTSRWGALSAPLDMANPLGQPSPSLAQQQQQQQQQQQRQGGEGNGGGEECKRGGGVVVETAHGWASSAAKARNADGSRKRITRKLSGIFGRKS